MTFETVARIVVSNFPLRIQSNVLLTIAVCVIFVQSK